jgi:hypothetical protein
MFANTKAIYVQYFAGYSSKGTTIYSVVFQLQFIKGERMYAISIGSGGTTEESALENWKNKHKKLMEIVSTFRFK